MPPSVGRIALRSISGRKAGEDHARSQCPEEPPGTQGPLRGDENYFKIRRKAPKSIGGRKAGEDHARSQCPEKHPGTQGCLRQEVMLLRRKPLRSTVNG